VVSAKSLGVNCFTDPESPSNHVGLNVICIFFYCDFSSEKLGLDASFSSCAAIHYLYLYVTSNCIVCLHFVKLGLV